MREGQDIVPLLGIALVIVVVMILVIPSSLGFLSALTSTHTVAPESTLSISYGYNLGTIPNDYPGEYDAALIDIHAAIAASNCTAVAIGIYDSMTIYWSIWSRLQAEINYSRSLPQVEKVYVVSYSLNPDSISRGRMLDYTNLSGCDAIVLDCADCINSFSYVPFISMDNENLTVWMLEFNSIAKMRGMDLVYYQGDGLDEFDASVMAAAGIIVWADLDVNGSLAWGSSHIDWTYPRLWINFWLDAPDFQPHDYASVMARDTICRTHSNVESYFMAAIPNGNIMPGYAETAISDIIAEGP